MNYSSSIEDVGCVVQCFKHQTHCGLFGCWQLFVAMAASKMEIDKVPLDGSVLPPLPAHAHPSAPAAISVNDCGRLHAIAQNAIALLQSLPHSAHLRAPLLAHLLRGLPAESAAQIAGVARSTVYADRAAFPPGELGELTRQYPHGVHRQVVGDEELSSMRALIRENLLSCGGGLRHLLSDDKLFERYIDSYAQSLSALVEQHMAHSGAPSEPAMETLVRKLNEHQSQLAFEAFARTAKPHSAVSDALAAGHRPGPIDEVLSLLDKPTSAPPAPRSRAVFDRVLKDMSTIRTTKDWGAWDCKHCAQGAKDKAELSRFASLQLPLSSADSEALDEAERAVCEFHDHLAVVHAQCAAVEQALSDPDPEHAVVWWDFGQLDAGPNVGDKGNKPFHVLMMVFQRGGSDQRVYVDFFVQDQQAQKPDIFFVREALLYTRNRTPFFSGLKLLTFISDTCAGEFRSRHAFGQMAAFQELCGFLVRLLFKAACHGKGLADAHKGHLARMITRQLKEQTLMRRQLPAAAADLLTPFPNAESLALFLRSSFKTVEYHAFVLPTVNRSPELKADVRRVPGTMTLHEVMFDSVDTMLVKHLSSDTRADVVHLHFRQPFHIEGPSRGNQ
jgi:hypothetical protein